MIRHRLQDAILVLLPLVIFFGLYLRALDYDFVWTDQGEIEYGILLRPPGRVIGALQQPMHPDLERLSPGSAQPYYRPLQVILVSLIHNEFGKRPRYFRAACLALGAITIVLFTAFARLLTGDLRLASLAGAVFAAHPAGIENYVWIAGLSAALAKCFIVASLLTAWLALQARTAGLRAGMTLFSIVSLLLGLLSKEDAVVTPALALACITSASVLRRRDDPEAGSRVSSLSFWKTASALLLLHGLVTAAFVLWWRPRILGGVLAGVSPIAGNPLVHGLTVLATWPDRLAWLFLPVQSTTSDVVRVVVSATDTMAWLGALMALISLAAWFRLLQRGQAIAALGLAWMWIAFLPCSGLVPLTHVRAERYLSLSVFGAALIWSALVSELARSRQPKLRQLLAPALALLLVLGLGERTWSRVPDWQSDISLFERDVSRDPLFREGYYILAVAHAEAGRLEEAKRWLQELKDMGPRFKGRWSFLRPMDASLLLCRINLGLSRGRETLEEFNGKLRADSEQLPRAAALFECGAHSLEQAGRVQEALAIFLRLRELNPMSPDPSLTLAVARCHARLGHLSEAAAWLDRLPAGASQDPRLGFDLTQVRAIIRREAPRR